MPIRLRLSPCLAVACGALGLAALATAAAPAAQAVPVDALAQRSAAPPDEAFALAVLAAVNRYRQRRGLVDLQPDPTLVTIAAEHSRSQAAQGRLDHAGFAQRFARSRALSCVENLAAGYRDAEAVVAAWHASPAHRDNLQLQDLQRGGLASEAGCVTLLACRFHRH